MKKIVVVIFCMFTVNCFSQRLVDINTIEREDEHCRNTSNDIIGCENLYYQRMDSILNIGYKKLKSIYTKEEFAKLKSEQIEWISLRDRQFKKIRLDDSFDNASEDVRQAQLISEKAFIVRDRATVLIKKNMAIKKTQ